MSETQNADEARWIVAARTKPAAFAPVYEHYVDRIYAYCARRTSPPEAEDLTSLVFARALAAVHDYRGGSVAAWLFRIAHNVVVNHYRDHHPALALDAAESPQPEPLDRLIEIRDHHARVVEVGGIQHRRHLPSLPQGGVTHCP